jgi:hypothetical protein
MGMRAGRSAAKAVPLNASAVPANKNRFISNAIQFDSAPQ